jgi:proteasome activator subunit 4
MQSHVIPLLCAILPGLDGNDTKKCLISFQFLASILASIPVVDCTPAVSLRDDLTEQESELCFLTAKFEDFIQEFFNKFVPSCCFFLDDCYFFY